MCAIEACEHALDIQPSEQTKLLRNLTMHGLIIRDHALHLYLFSMPDIYGKDAFLDFDENDPEQHQMLHDAFEVKAAGNYLASVIAGRSVHGTYPTIGGYLHFPEKSELEEAVKKIEAIRPAVLRLIEVYRKAPFHLDRKTHFMALVPFGNFGYLDGEIVTSEGERYGEDKFREHLEHTVIPWSMASGYEYKGKDYMVGALARINLAKDKLHPKTKESLKEVLALFPSTDIFHNNLAQAVEILHSVDEAIELLKNSNIVKEPLVKKPFREAIGVGVIEAPRGTLYHKVHLGPDGIIKDGEVIVPTGQNQINIERDLGKLVESLLPNTPKEKIEMEMEKLIRAYDPCMSCASHFLKVKWE
jgi:coenzyme F420-reducing hydrogenase alpha subunit